MSAGAGAGGASAKPAVRVEGLRAGYAPGAPVLEEVSFTVDPGTVVAVLGANGGGKTTLLRALLGELREVQGTVELSGTPSSVPQTERTRLDYPVSALDVALMGAWARTPWWRRVARADRERAHDALDRVGLLAEARTRFGALSGGQRQRVLLARALVHDGPVLCLDEPLSGVDRVSAARIEAVFGELRDAGKALLVATHDVAQAQRADRVLCVNHRLVAAGPPAAVLDAETLAQTYGGELVVLGDGRALAVDHHGH